jgi:glycyl-tRNA synthetase beta chain
MAELLIEFYSEEIPAGIQESSVRNFQSILLKNFVEAGLGYKNSETFWSPMRLVVYVDGMALKSKDVEVDNRGPRVDAKEMAISGFAKGFGITIKELIKEETGKGTFYFYKHKKKGVNAQIIIESAIKNLILNFPWKKSMRWGSNNIRWIRPLHKILCVFDGVPIKFNIENINSDSTTYGHRYISPDKITIKNKDDYIKKLLNSNVLVDANSRKERILKEGKDLASKFDLIFKPEKFLLEEVSNIVEYPHLFSGEFDEEYLSLPEQILELTMIKQQKYFPLYNLDNSLSKKFIGVSNIPIDDKNQIVLGNERVLKARLSDASFFFDNDIKIGLEKLSEGLKNIIFHNSLGTMDKKIQRVSFIAKKFAKTFNADAKLVVSAVNLAKSDLCSEVVHEMPELQGIIGSIYAVKQGLPNKISIAIREHYSPLGPSDNCPTTPESSLLSLSDKLDSLIGFIAIDLKATGSKDPFGLRRSCLGIIRIILDNKIRISLSNLISESYKSYKKQGVKLILSKDEVNRIFIDFVYDRLKVFMRDKGLSQSSIQAVYSVSKFSDVYDDISKIEALEKFINNSKGRSLLNILKRVRRILSIEEKKHNMVIDTDIKESLLELNQEKELYDYQTKISKEVSDLLNNEEYENAMEIFSSIAIYLENFFDHVQVNVENKEMQSNRLKLLSLVRSIFVNFADFSLIDSENEVT